jgi:hypothetical protein
MSHRVSKKYFKWLDNQDSNMLQQLGIIQKPFIHNVTSYEPPKQTDPKIYKLDNNRYVLLEDKNNSDNHSSGCCSVM